jgi:uncharacterized membrane protein
MQLILKEKVTVLARIQKQHPQKVTLNLQPATQVALATKALFMIKKYFFTGLLVLVPLIITAWVLTTLINTLDQSLLLLPETWRPKAFLGQEIPGFGVLLTLLTIFITGVIATNIFGQQLIAMWEALVSRVPVVKSIYSSVKQVSDTLFSSSGNAFRKALLVQYPRQGSWTIAFLTGIPSGEVMNHLHGEYISVYVPTTPNPTSGFFLMMPKADVIELDMSVDQALKYIISMGVVSPNEAPPKILTHYPE